MSELTKSSGVEGFLQSVGEPGHRSQQALYKKLLNFNFPTTRDENWKYTRVGKIANGSFRLQKNVSSELDLQKFIQSDHVVVLENGNFFEEIKGTQPECSTEFLDPGHTSTVPVDENDIFVLMNRCYVQKVLWIHIPAGKKLTKPLQVLLVSTEKGIIASPSIYVTVGKGANAEVTVSAVSVNNAENFNNLVFQAHLEENAKLTLNSIQDEGVNGLLVSNSKVIQEKGSEFVSNTATLSGALVRNNLHVEVAGENCSTHLNGIVVAGGKSHVDNHTFVNHEVANCFSNEAYRYVLGDAATGVFNGRVVVQKDAQKINAYQNNANVILSDTAHMNSKPELEIYANDVKCTHGSTTGQLDSQALFYLQSRGISKHRAEKILVTAFVSEILAAFRNDEFRTFSQNALALRHGWEFID
jgi:Fe-S cluster assembly protein SufD